MEGPRQGLRACRDPSWRARNRPGEFIGEHGLVDHGFYPWEANARVFVVAAGTEETALPGPWSATAVFHLVRDGRLPGELPAVESVAGPHVRRGLHTRGRALGSVSLARWTGWQKLLWMDGTFSSFSLDSDPLEARGEEVVPPADFAALARRVEAAVEGEVAERQAGVVGDDALREALEAAGYIE